jgi:hypothetical protein
MSACHRPYIGAGAASILPKCKQFLDLLHRKTEISGTANEPKRVDVSRLVNPVPRSRPFRWLNQSGFFIIADHLGRDAGFVGCLPDVHDHFSFILAQSRELVFSRHFPSFQ